jgi:hypothetical protein
MQLLTLVFHRDTRGSCDFSKTLEDIGCLMSCIDATDAEVVELLTTLLQKRSVAVLQTLGAGSWLSVANLASLRQPDN